MNKIEKVLESVYNHDKHSLGLCSRAFYIEPLSQSDFDKFAPSFQLRTKMIAYDFAFIIYSKKYGIEKPDKLWISTFKNYLNHDKNGKKLIEMCEKLAEEKLSKTLDFQAVKNCSINSIKNQQKNQVYSKLLNIFGFISGYFIFGYLISLLIKNL